MPTSTKVIAIGNSVGVILPKETLARLNVEVGDTLHLNETSWGLELSAYEDEFAAKVGVVDHVTRRYRDAPKKPTE